MSGSRAVGPLLVAIAAACAPPPDPDPALEEGQPASAELSAAALRNAAYRSDYLEEGRLTLADGRYDDTLRRVHVTMLPRYAVGDLDGDGRPDAAVVLATNTGGSGVFETLVAVLDRDGEPVHAASAYLGDRVRVGRLAIEERLVVLELIEHGPGEPMCCPTVSAERRFRLDGHVLTEVGAKREGSGSDR